MTSGKNTNTLKVLFGFFVGMVFSLMVPGLAMATEGSVTGSGHYGVDDALVANKVTPKDSLYYDTITDASTNKKSVIIDGYKGDLKRVVVPTQIDGIDVTMVSAYAFQGDTAIEEVYLPDTVTIIDREAFMDCSALRCVNLGGLRTGSTYTER